MPFYRVYYSASLFDAVKKQAIVNGITTQHSAVTGAPTSAVKIVFIPVAPEDSYSDGQSAPFVRVVGLVKSGRDAETRARLLGALTRVFVPYLESDVIELTLIENRPEDTVRFAGAGTSEALKDWAAQLPAQAL